MENAVCDLDFPWPGTPEWGLMTRRRAELIHKRNVLAASMTDLDPVEEAEYQRLQQLTSARLEEAFPTPTELADKLAALEAKLEQA